MPFRLTIPVRLLFPAHWVGGGLGLWLLLSPVSLAQSSLTLPPQPDPFPPVSPNPNNAGPTNLDLETTTGPAGPVLSPPPAPIEDGIPISNYLLGVGDALAINVIGYPEFASQQTILPDGTINLPLIGPLHVQGQTLEELTRTLTESLQVFLVNPVVSLNLGEQRPILITITGEVNRPGPVSFEAIGGGLHLSDALIEAGGVRRSANISRITIRRPLPQGQEQLLVVDLWQTIQAEIAGQSLVLRDGDVVFVPQRTEAEDLDQRLIARSSLAPEAIRVHILGEVQSQGELILPPHLTLSEALAMAGGPTPASRTAHTTLLRRRDDGTVEERQINLKDYRNTEQVQDGDIIIVSKRFIPRILDWSQRVGTAVSGPLSLFRLIQQVVSNDSDSNNN
ncbi:MAG: polysaccharide biosynthesis/export family protein [Prochlorothrix sp.]